MGHYAAQWTFEEEFWIIPPLSSSFSTSLPELCLRGSYTLPLGMELVFVQLSGKPPGPLLSAGS